MQMEGVWSIEFAELDAISRSQASRIKAFMSRTTERYRPPYGHRLVERPRSCVFWGTTNSDTYLKDETGGRRFWPIKARKIDIRRLEEMRPQLWAEASALYAAGVKWWLLNPAAIETAEQLQGGRLQLDPWHGPIEEYLQTVADVSVEEILRDVLQIEIGGWTQNNMNRVARCLVACGFMRMQVRIGDKRPWRYRKLAS